MYTDREVREILEQVYAEAYDAGIDDTLEYFEENYELEDDSFDLMDEYGSYNETMSKSDKADLRKRIGRFTRDEGESDKEYNKRREHFVRSNVADVATGSNKRLADRMDELGRNANTGRVRGSMYDRRDKYSKASSRMKNAATKYNYLSDIDMDKRSIRNKIKEFKNS